MSRTGLATIVIGAMTAFAPLAQADQTQDECIDGFEEAQRLRLDGKYEEAREKLLVCSRPVCPKVTQPDCAKWLTEVDARLPTVIVSARDSSGHDLNAVKVFIDGRSLTEKLDGHPITANPGPHTFRYEVDDGRVVEERVVLNEGEKDRRITVEFAKMTPAAPARPEKPENARPRAAVPTVSWVLGGASVLTLSGFVAFAVAGKSVEECVPNCSRSEFDSYRRNYLVADVLLGAALISGGLAVYFALTSRSAAH